MRKVVRKGLQWVGVLSARAGYTPLHMAVGYSHVGAVAALLDAGANPEVQDRQSRDVIALVESIQEKMPISPEWMGKRMALEQVISLLGGEYSPPTPAQRVLPWVTLCLTFLTALLGSEFVRLPTLAQRVSL